MGRGRAFSNNSTLHAVDDAVQVILDEAFPDLGEQGAGVDVRTAIESPNNLLQLDLYAVAEANRSLFKLPTLVDMLFELLAPYQELRLHSAVPSDEDAFYLRHGETRESLKVGMQLQLLQWHVELLQTLHSFKGGCNNASPSASEMCHCPSATQPCSITHPIKRPFVFCCIAGWQAG